MVEPGMTRDVLQLSAAPPPALLLPSLVKTYNADIAHISDLKPIYAAL